MHGTLECLGDAHQLCLLKHLPLSTFNDALSCMNYPSPFPTEIGHAGFAKSCVRAARGVWEGPVEECIEGKKGSLGREAEELLWESSKKTREMEVLRSCTIHIDTTVQAGKKHRTCMVDGGVWSGCDVSRWSGHWDLSFSSGWHGLAEAVGMCRA
jgi:hypothetical protein